MMSFLIAVLPFLNVGCVWDPDLPLPTDSACNYIWQSRRPADVNFVIFISAIGISMCGLVVALNVVTIGAIYVMYRKRRKTVAFALPGLPTTSTRVSNVNSTDKTAPEESIQQAGSDSVSGGSKAQTGIVLNVETKLLAFLLSITITFVACWLPLLVSKK